MQSPKSILAQHWALSDVVLEPALRGHTNQTWFLHGGPEPLVLRQSWAGKHAAQVEREEAVLHALRGGPLAVPKLIFTVEGDAHAFDAADRRFLHVFERIPGEPAQPWLRSSHGACVRAAIAGLSSLHEALAALPDGEAPDPVEWLRMRFKRVTQVELASAELSTELPRVLDAIDTCLSRVRAPSRSQWLHGDLSLGNMLFDGERLAGFVDFDDVGRGAPILETALALFALSRREDRDDQFACDEALWEAGLESCDGDTRRFLRECREEHAQLFCAQQVLIHLEAFQHGLWKPARGIGFWSCWNALSPRAR